LLVRSIERERPPLVWVSLNLDTRNKGLPNGLSLPGEYVGTGELVMDTGGNSFTGNVLGAATSGGTFIGR